MTAIRQEILVRKDGILEVRSPELRIGDEAEVIVLIKPAPSQATEKPIESFEDLTDWRQFAGIFRGDHGSADNESIDRDLAAEYGSDHEPAK